MTQSPDGKIWEEYYERVNGRPPRKTLVKAVELFDGGAAKFAIDLGCGTGVDTHALLHLGWRVLAIDKQAEGIAYVESGTPEDKRPYLETQVAPFETLPQLPPADLINASFSLPFCQPDHFESLWQNIVYALRKNGRFSGQLFGVNDSWAENPNLNFHTKAAVLQRLAPFALDYFEEEDADGTTARGDEKHWHIFHIVARKR